MFGYQFMFDVLAEKNCTSCNVVLLCIRLARFLILYGDTRMIAGYISWLFVFLY